MNSLSHRVSGRGVLIEIGISLDWGRKPAEQDPLIITLPPLSRGRFRRLIDRLIDRAAPKSAWYLDQCATHDLPDGSRYPTLK